MNEPTTSNVESAPAVAVQRVVSHRHWTDGGTALTNFDPKDEAKYLSAIEAHGDPAYVVVRAPMDKRGSIATDYSLHYLDMPTKRSSSPFWETCRKVANAPDQGRRANDSKQP